MQAFAIRVFGIACVLLAAALPSEAPAQLIHVQQKQQAKNVVPKRALPLPNKPVSEDEIAKAVRINNWTVGVAGGLLEGTFSSTRPTSARRSTTATTCACCRSSATAPSATSPT